MDLENLKLKKNAFCGVFFQVFIQAFIFRGVRSQENRPLIQERLQNFLYAEEALTILTYGVEGPALESLQGPRAEPPEANGF